MTKDSDIVCTITNVRETGDLTVIKDLNPDDDPGVFNLQVDEADGGSPMRATAATTGAVTVNTGSHTVGETAGTATSLGNYSSSIECVDRTVAWATSSPSGRRRRTARWSTLHSVTTSSA